MFKKKTVRKFFILFLPFTAILILWSLLGNVETAQAQLPQPDSIGLPPPGLCTTWGSDGSLYEPGVNCRLTLVDGYPRAFIVFVPRTVQEPAPVVFMFHGSSGDGYQYLKISGWREKANQEGLIAVFPTGLKYCKVGFSCEDGGAGGWTTKWHDYELIEDQAFNFDIQPLYYSENADWPAADVAFTHTMLDDILDEANGLDVDTDRVYASGFSAGASFSARLAVELSDRLAAVGYVSGGLVAVKDPENQPLQPVANIPVYAMFGTNDTGIMEHVSWDTEDGELPLDPQSFLDIDGMVSYYITPHLDGFEHHYSPVTLQPFEAVSFTHATAYRWETQSAGSNQAYTFMLTVLEGLEHKYPNGCHTKNPYCFVAADMFWLLFQEGSEAVFSPGENLAQ